MLASVPVLAAGLMVQRFLMRLSIRSWLGIKLARVLDDWERNEVRVSTISDETPRSATSWGTELR